jgi:CubicO group peptidase (beta-lactamase class C family)
MRRNASAAGALVACLILGAPAAHADVATPSSAFSQERLDRIGVALEREIADRTIPGAVTLIAHRGEIVHLEAHGSLDADRAVPMETDTLFRALSMSKPVTSVAAMMLVEEGRIALRDPVAKWLPELEEMTVLVPSGEAWEEVPAERSITVHDLLRHTAGFGYIGNVPAPIDEAYISADIESVETDFPPEEFLARLAGIPLAHQPGTVWHYGLSTDVLGVLIERVTGARLDEALETMIFAPLGMENTMWQVEGDDLDRLADAFPEDPLRDETWRHVRAEADPGARYRIAGAGMVTTAEDFFRFAQMALNGGELDGTRLLAPKTVDLMLADHIAGLAGEPRGTAGPGYGFGLGFGVRRHEGGSWTPGSVGDAMWAGLGGTSFTIDPVEEIVGVFMSAGPSTRLHTRFLFKSLLYGALEEPANRRPAPTF